MLTPLHGNDEKIKRLRAWKIAKDDNFGESRATLAKLWAICYYQNFSFCLFDDDGLLSLLRRVKITFSILMTSPCIAQTGSDSTHYFINWFHVLLSLSLHISFDSQFLSHINLKRQRRKKNEYYKIFALFLFLSKSKISFLRRQKINNEFHHYEIVYLCVNARARGPR